MAQLVPLVLSGTDASEAIRGVLRAAVTQHAALPPTLFHDAVPAALLPLAWLPAADRWPGATLLHLAAHAGNQATVTFLLREGAPWNAVTLSRYSVGEAARAAGHAALYQFLVEEGARTEMLMTALEAAQAHASDASDNDDAKPLRYVDANTLVDDENNGVMMGWEAPLMARHAAVIAPTPGRRVLNVGFGLGLVDTALQHHQPAQHVIIEAHPDVYAKMQRDGWLSRPGVEVYFGTWQDVLPTLGVFDGIFFDTFSEHYADLKAFHDEMINHLDGDGIYSFFNGLAGTNPFFHDVACDVAQADLADLGLATHFEVMPVAELGDATWQGLARAYWSLPEYRLPICRFAM
ncbi:hypothetical protein CXG81DRAFT_8421 [Caulochytrium protostelioides]|uniref:RMT2 domain-containing protein n=1 Tax=Caulochytrium protostelioides TaxID=1555241 RepID=A0A4P9XGE1_9FUNG|nr:hypothetical protein CXG81DRAFT_8421 [Caulochytrium protostelioides]|eukprot:RKP04301.1 hypothetical protein CXG81DRAFT_8421 [Caulochytrium protostelioides]